MAGIQPIRLTSPRGRFVQGDAFEPQTTDQHSGTGCLAGTELR